MSEFHAEAPQATASEGLAQGQVGFEPMTIQTKGVKSANKPPRPTQNHNRNRNRKLQTSKAPLKSRALACSRTLRQIRGVVKRIVNGRFRIMVLRS